METTPRPTLLLLVRHGQTPTTGQVLPGRAPGLDLSPQGQRQAAAVAQRLADLPVSAIYTSPLERARQTAAATAELLGLDPVLEPGLLECDFGDWTGAELARLTVRPEWATVQQAPSTFRFPNGESFAQMQQRIVGALDVLRTRHREGVVVCFSHADPIKAALVYALGVHLDLFQRIVVSPCSVSVIAYPSTGAPTVWAVNSTGDSLAQLKAS